jgi:exocyst complex component 2
MQKLPLIVSVHNPAFYKDMKFNNLLSTESYGIAPFTNSLHELAKSAQKLYGPVLERRSKADQIRITLTILEQWRFFFNLPSSLTDLITKGRYQSVVRDYKKGKSLMQKSFSDKYKKPAEQKWEAATYLPKSYQNVFEKVWCEVDKIIDNFRNHLSIELKNPLQTPESQEKIIEYLWDLDAKCDPLLEYLNSQYLHIIEKATLLFNNSVSFLQGFII